MKRGVSMAIKIFIDQGHNPVNPNAGAEGSGYREQDLVYYIGKELEALLNANPNFEARTSRNSPDEVLGTSTSTSLSARVNAANSWPADYFISIHANASNIVSASGSEAYVYTVDSPAYDLAEDILLRLSEATGLADRGVFPRPTLYVLRRTQMPALLLEVGFITNPSDAALMAENPALIARGIYNGILTYFGL
jgi:N-acetylmuramoyl-L-alanine amidase